MKKITILMAMLLASFASFAQNNPIDFEDDGFGADWTWTVFENADNPPLEIIDNPDMNGNTSAKVAQFTARADGNPWAGVESAHGNSDLGGFVLDETNSTITIMVWKSTISDVGVKLIAETGWAQPEIKVANTVVNEWEELTFDFSDFPNPPAAEGLYDQIAIFPDFVDGNREQENIVYFDNITFSGESDGGDNGDAGPAVAAPTPMQNEANVISVFSDAYTDIPGVDLNPNWGQATQVSTVTIGGNNTLKYEGLNYQGIDLGGNQDVSEMEFLHLDYWTDNSSELSVFAISPGPVETPVALNVPTSGWTSIDIPISDFTPVDLAELIQFKFEGNGDIYLDNIYLWKEGEDNGNGETAGPRNPIDFEDDGFGADWTWTVFENADNPPLEIIDNPDMNGNTSAKVAQFTARADGNPWAGVESAHGNSDLGGFVLDETNSTITIMVWKSTISDVGIKLIAETGWAQPEIKVANTVVNEWEELTFDFSDIPNPPAAEGLYDQIAIFPDFVDGNREQENIVYFDNITFSGASDGGDNGDTPEGNLVTNGDFESGDDGSWYGNAFNIQTEGGNSFNFADVATAGNPWDVNLSQLVELTPGESYLFTFDASTSEGNTRDMVVGIGQSQSPYYADVETVTLTETTQTYSLYLAATDDGTGNDFGGADSRVIFDMGADVGIVVLDNVSLEVATIEAFSLLSPPDETSLSLTGDGTAEAVIEWSEAVSGSDVTYVWHADLPGSDFSDPLVSIPSDDNGQATSLTLTFAALDQALAGLGVDEGESIDLEWTVTASDESSVRFADEVFAITLSRELGVSNELNESPRSFVLNQNYPNPFNPTTSISYAIPESADVKLEVFNAVGQKVATLVNSTQNAGSHTVSFDASNLASGVYLYRLTSGNQVQINKMLLLK